MTQDRMTFSFRCPRTLKDAFSAKAKANKTTASALIKDFMEAYVNGSYDKSTDNKNRSTDGNDKSTDVTDQSVLEELRSRIAALEAKVDNKQEKETNGVKFVDEDGVGTSHPRNDTVRDRVGIDTLEQSQDDIVTSEQTFTSKEIAQEYQISDSNNLHRWRRGTRKPTGENLKKWNEIKEKYDWDDKAQRWKPIFSVFKE